MPQVKEKIMSSSDHSLSSSQVEPSSGTDLDDQNIVDADRAEALIDDVLSVDQEAEREANEAGLALPAQIRAAEREIRMREQAQRAGNLPAFMRNQQEQRYNNEDIATQLRQLQFDSSSPQQQASQSLQIQSDMSIQSDQLRNYQLAAQDFQLKIVQPVNDATFKIRCQNFVGQVTNQGLKIDIINKILHFLQTHRSLTQLVSSDAKYVSKARELFRSPEKSSLQIDMNDILEYNQDLYSFIVDSPKIFLPVLDDTVTEFLKQLEPRYQQVHPQVRARVYSEENVIPLRKLRVENIDKLVNTRGIIIQKFQKQNKLIIASLICRQCGNVIDSIELKQHILYFNKEIDLSSETYSFLPKRCSNENCKSTRLTLNQTGCVYNDYQKIVIQEAPEDTEFGFLPEKREMIIDGDLISQVNAGDTVNITGVYKMIPLPKQTLKRPVAETVMQVVSMNSKSDLGFSFTPQDREALDALVLRYQGADLDQLLVNSIAPSIYGHNELKESILATLAGGVKHKISISDSTRGDLHMLMLGDPGVAKSQLLKYIEKTAPKVVFASGKGASAAGLTVAVKKAGNGEFMLQAGAMVLASGGVCLIDELDKMDDQDRSALHQAMEQQEVSVAKAGIVASLPAECSVIAAANPIGQQYNSHLNVNANTRVGEALLSRFDLICVVRDVVDRDNDKKLAEFIVRSHAMSHSTVQSLVVQKNQFQAKLDVVIQELVELNEIFNENMDQHVEKREELQQLKKSYEEKNQQIQQQIDECIIPSATNQQKLLPEEWEVGNIVTTLLQEGISNIVLPQSFIKKFLYYAKRFEPTIGPPCLEKLRAFYIKIRQLQVTGGTPVSQRQIHTLIRLSEAHAKLHLRRTVTLEDADYAIRLFAGLFITQQKQNIQRRIEVQIRRLETGAAEHNVVITNVLDDIVRVQHRYMLNMGETFNNVRITIQHLRSECQKISVEVSEGFWSSIGDGYELERDGDGHVVAIVKRL